MNDLLFTNRLYYTTLSIKFHQFSPQIRQVRKYSKIIIRKIKYIGEINFLKSHDKTILDLKHFARGAT